MKFKKPIEVEAGISDGDPLFPLGQSGYLLSSDGSNVSWVSPGGLSAETAEAIVQPIKANEALTKGDPLYIVGYQLGQDVNIVAKADSSDVAKMPVVGLADDDYANQAFGTMTAFGSFNGAFDTSGGTEGWSVGDIIFVKPLGGLTNIKPGGTDLIQNVAIVSRVSTQTGELEVIALGRTNDVPNLPTGRLFVGTAANTSLASDVVYVDDTNDRVGINTATPAYDLDVDGVLRARSTSYFSTDGPISIAQLGGGSTTLSQFNITTTASGSSFISATNTLSIKANNTTAIKIDNAGNVGIGTTNPTQKLHVDGNARLTGLFYDGTNSGGTNGQILSSDGGQTEWIDGSAIPGVPAGSGTINYLARWTPDANTLGIGVTYDNGTNVGIGTINPQTKLDVNGSLKLGTTGTFSISQSPFSTTQFYVNGGGNGGTILFGVPASYQQNVVVQGDLHTAGGITSSYLGTKQFNSWNNRLDPSGNNYLNSGNLGIGTTNPNSKLQVEGEIDANGGDGYRINGRPWAAESSGNLRLGDWDGEGFTTSIFDDNGAEIVTIENYGTMIKCSSLVSSYGANASLAVGTAGATSAGAAVVTLSNSDTTASAGDSTGTIQFAIKADAGTTLGYTSAAISGSIFSSAGTGNSGGGILDFKTSLNGAGNSPQTRMRINQLGQVGIGTTSIGSGFKLDVNGEIHSSTYVSATAGLGVDNTSGQLGRGISLYAGPVLYPQYGLLFAQTVDLGTYGGVSGDWATYMTMSGTATRGWIWKAGTTNSTAGNVASISGVGQLTLASTATATNFILSSDETLKDNIKEIDTKHVDVDWKNFELKSEPGIKRAGVIAQELEIKHPEFVRTADDGLKSVAYIDLLITKIAELEARLEKAGL